MSQIKISILALVMLLMLPVFLASAVIGIVVFTCIFGFSMGINYIATKVTNGIKHSKRA